MRSRAAVPEARPRPFHLVDIGVGWPPQTFIMRRLAGLAARGARVTVVTSSEDRRPPPPGISVVRLPLSGSNRARQAVRTARAAVALAARGPARVAQLACVARGVDQVARVAQYAAVAGLDPDIVHFEWNAEAVSYLPLFDLWDCPIVISSRGQQINTKPLVPDPAYQEKLTESLRRAAAVHCVSRQIARTVRELGVDPARIAVIPPAVDPEVFRPEPGARPDGFHVAVVGAFLWVKGHEFAIRAFARLLESRPDAVLHMVGSGKERERVLFTIHDLGLADRVHLHGDRTPEQVLELLQRCHAYLLSSHSEGISNSVLEAMACELPVVSTECGGMAEVITDGVDGFLVPPRDVEGMAAALARIAADPALATRVGRAARARIQAAFRLDQQIDAWAALYARLLEERS